ncbi:MAG: hypothetical protein Q9185_006615 [Variospora sp. 1 TL-2023]
MLPCTLIFLLLLLHFTPTTTATPVCENPLHGLPALSGCLKLIAAILAEAKTYPYLYEWTRHPDPLDSNQRQLPHTWVDRSPPYTYQCAVTIDTMSGTGTLDVEGDSFTYRDVSVVASRVVNQCLRSERGIRPQIGWDLIGFIHRPKVVRVWVHSMRLPRMGGRNRTGVVEFS